MASIAGIAGAGAILFLLVFLSVMIVSIVLQLIAVHKMSISAGFSNPWLSYVIPVHPYALGRLAARYVKDNGKKSAKWGVLLEVFYILYVVFYIFIVMPSNLLTTWVNQNQYLLESDVETATTVLVLLLVALVLLLLALAVMITYLVFQYIVFYRICKAYDPDHATMYLVISIVTCGLTTPFFLFAMRNKTPKFTPEERFANNYNGNAGY